jgi:hypothetical protein
MKIVSSIAKTTELEQRLGFSVWAKNNPKDYLVEYPQAAATLRTSGKFKSVALTAIVDDILPRVILGRSLDEQATISAEYLKLLPNIGFDVVHLVSEFVPENFFWGYLKFAPRFSGSQFMKLLPEGKHLENKSSFSEVVSFLWHLYVLEAAVDHFALTGFLAGIRSEYFYLAVRQVIPKIDVYFLGTSR